MNIFRTFEIFLREPLSILRDKFIQIVNVQTTVPNQPSSISADILNSKAQITVVNNEKVYSLLTTAMYKQRLREESRKALAQR